MYSTDISFCIFISVSNQFILDDVREDYHVVVFKIGTVEL